MDWIIKEMEEVRAFCSLINKARNKAGFQSLKYPLHNVFVNRYFLPDFREIISDECNLIGYMDIPPVEFAFEDEFEKSESEYITEGDTKGRLIKLSTTKSAYQDRIFNKNVIRREQALERKNNGK